MPLAASVLKGAGPAQAAGEGGRRLGSREPRTLPVATALYPLLLPSSVAGGRSCKRRAPCLSTVSVVLFVAVLAAEGTHACRQAPFPITMQLLCLTCPVELRSCAPTTWILAAWPCRSQSVAARREKEAQLAVSQSLARLKACLVLGQGGDGNSCCFGLGPLGRERVLRG